MCLSQRTKIFTFSQILSMLLIFIIKNLIHLCKVLLLTERDMKQLLFTLLAFFIYTGCTENRIASKQENTYPNIFPDYKEISIPINIAPLNFTVKNSSHIKAIFSNNNQPLFSIEGKNKIDIPLKKWRHIISRNIGKQIDISISIWNNSYPEGVQYKSFPIYITTDSIDPYIAYRLVEPGYESWHEMDIRQRALNCFKEEIIISSNMTEKGCVNCHSFCNYSPTDFMFHARTTPGGTIIIKNNQPVKVQLSQLGSSKEGTYPHWHPSGKYIIFSTNATRQSFYSRNPNLIEVYDLESDLILYDPVRKHSHNRSSFQRSGIFRDISSMGS